MSEYPGYKNYATFVASVSLSEKIQKLRIERPNMSILDVKRECVEFLIQHSNHDTVGALIHLGFIFRHGTYHAYKNSVKFYF